MTEVGLRLTEYTDYPMDGRSGIDVRIEYFAVLKDGTRIDTDERHGVTVVALPFRVGEYEDSPCSDANEPEAIPWVSALIQEMREDQDEPFWGPLRLALRQHGAP